MWCHLLSQLWGRIWNEGLKWAGKSRKTVLWRRWWRHEGCQDQIYLTWTTGLVDHSSELCRHFSKVAGKKWKKIQRVGCKGRIAQKSTTEFIPRQVITEEVARREFLDRRRARWNSLQENWHYTNEWVQQWIWSIWILKDKTFPGFEVFSCVLRRQPICNHTQNLC